MNEDSLFKCHMMAFMGRVLTGNGPASLVVMGSFDVTYIST